MAGIFLQDCFVVLRIIINNLERIPTMFNIIHFLEQFAPVFSDRVWRHALTLLIGAILCHKERTVAAILRVMGLGNGPHFTNYHRVLSKARWSGLQAAKILLVTISGVRGLQ